jgi:hypothetical protein
VQANRSRPGEATAQTAIAAVALLGLAAVFSVLAGVPKVTELTPGFASDRSYAAAAAQAAGIAMLFVVVAGATAERRRVREPLSRIDTEAAVATGTTILGAVALGALAIAVRLAYAPPPMRVDFAEVVTNLSLGNGYTRGTPPALDPTALHPPLAPVLAAIFPGRLDAVQVLVSSLVVLAVAGLGARIGGLRAAIGAGIIAALLPSLWGLQLPEALAALGVTAGVFFAWPDRATASAAALAGACLGLAVLARPEAVLAIPVVVAWMVLRTRWNAPPVIACALVAMLVVGPWLAWTQTRFGTILPSTSLGTTIAGANVDSVVHGERLGELDPLPPPPSGTNEGFVDSRRRHAGLDRFWTKRTPVVIVARLGRAWDIWSPASVRSAREARGLSTPGGGPGVLLEAAASLILLAWLAARRRDWVRLLPLYALPIAFTLLSAVTYGSRDLRGWTAPIVALAVGSFLAEVARRPPAPVAPAR